MPRSDHQHSLVVTQPVMIGALGSRNSVIPLHPTEICGSEAQSRCREAQADGEYAEALSRCGAAAASLDAIQGLAVAGGLAASVDELAADMAAQLASALQAVCTDFGGQQFMRVGSGSGS